LKTLKSITSILILFMCTKYLGFLTLLQLIFFKSTDVTHDTVTDMCRLYPSYSRIDICKILQWVHCEDMDCTIRQPIHTWYHSSVLSKVFTLQK